ncbi:MAG: helix-turn-helix domain-containing protein [Halobellus sp.]|uniref:helix-turn-helix domain-containing protein n=1 Tax=Halobellus sp. TaxID=1979212 RepID=UPI0035D5141D
MADGIRAKLAVDVAADCPVAELSALEDADGSERPTVRNVTWTRATDDTVTEEFRVDSTVAVENPEAVANADSVMEIGDDRVYQFTRDADVPCACEVVERLDSPISDVYATDGTLVLTLCLPDTERLREIVAELNDLADRVALQYLVRSTAEEDDGRDPIVVNRGALTERQREVLRTAYRLGYFEYRGGANAGDVAESLGINDSTLAEHLSKAQSKLLENLLRTSGGGTGD